MSYLQARYSPCKDFKSLLKFTNEYGFGGNANSLKNSVLLNATASHPKLAGWTLGLNGLYDLNKHTVKDVEIGERLDLANS